jgi:NAD(P)-dependent dehydrogenase (short-subunit alcohol dehydrogenase family)
MPLQINLEKKQILVTGASRGIGQAIAKSLAAAGARVAVHCNTSLETAEEIASEIGNNSQAFKADLGIGKGPVQLWSQVIEEFGHIDGLVNNAGVAISSDLYKSDSEWLHDWGHTMMVNLNSVGLLCKKAVEHMVTNANGGRIVNISSRAAFRGDTADYLAYAASKGGVVALTRSLARAFGKQNIKAFTVAPGFTQTEMAQEFIDQYGKDYAMQDIALPTLTQPQDIAPTVAFLLSGLADHATGSTIDINAGSYVH